MKAKNLFYDIGDLIDNAIYGKLCVVKKLYHTEDARNNRYLVKSLKNNNFMKFTPYYCFFEEVNFEVIV